MAEVDRGMEVGELKKLLSKSKSEPVNAAFGIDGKNAVIMLDKVKQPKALTKQLEDKFKGVKNMRWGTASVDIDADPKLVVLTVNRASAGAGRLLKKTLKGTGFSKVRIQLEDGSVAEEVGEEDEQQEQAQPEAGAAAEEEAEPAQAAAPEGAAEEQQASQQEAPAAQLDVAGLTKRLTELVKKIPQFPDRASDLKQLATKAGMAIKAGDQSATEALDQLEQQMQPSSGASNGAANGAADGALQKSSQIWVATRKKLEDEIGKLHDAMAKHYQGHGFSTDLEKVFQQKVQPILTSLDQSLADKLNEAVQNKDPAQRSKLLGEARQLIDKYDGFVSTDPLLGKLDDNPFVPLALVKTAKGTLAALKKSVPAT